MSDLSELQLVVFGTMLPRGLWAAHCAGALRVLNEGLYGEAAGVQVEELKLVGRAVCRVVGAHRSDACGRVVVVVAIVGLGDGQAIGRGKAVAALIAELLHLQGGAVALHYGEQPGLCRDSVRGGRRQQRHRK